MGQQQTIAAVLERGRGMLAKHLADFSDADMVARSSPAANHAAYQIGHLIRTTIDMVRAFTPDLDYVWPPKTDNAGKAPPTSDDVTAFATKAELLAGWEALVDALIAGVRRTPEADFDKPSPEQFKGFAPTLGALALMTAFHMSMHVGQIQAIRRKLGKPVLF
jgi:hypothetical protein